MILRGWANRYPAFWTTVCGWRCTCSRKCSFWCSQCSRADATNSCPVIVTTDPTYASRCCWHAEVQWAVGYICYRVELSLQIRVGGHSPPLHIRSLSVGHWVKAHCQVRFTDFSLLCSCILEQSTRSCPSAILIASDSTLKHSFLLFDLGLSLVASLWRYSLTVCVSKLAHYY